jgi:hypothetical protein
MVYLFDTLAHLGIVLYRDISGWRFLRGSGWPYLGVDAIWEWRFLWVTTYCYGTFGYDAEPSLSLFISLDHNLTTSLYMLTSFTALRYSMGWKRLLVFFDHGKFIVCWVTFCDIFKQLRAHKYAAAVGGGQHNTWFTDRKFSIGCLAEWNFNYLSLMTLHACCMVLICRKW